MEGQGWEMKKEWSRGKKRKEKEGKFRSHNSFRKSVSTGPACRQVSVRVPALVKDGRGYILVRDHCSV